MDLLTYVNPSPGWAWPLKRAQLPLLILTFWLQNGPCQEFPISVVGSLEIFVINHIYHYHYTICIKKNDQLSSSPSENRRTNILLRALDSFTNLNKETCLSCLKVSSRGTWRKSLAIVWLCGYSFLFSSWLLAQAILEADVPHIQPQPIKNGIWFKVVNYDFWEILSHRIHVWYKLPTFTINSNHQVIQYDLLIPQLGSRPPFERVTYLSQKANVGKTARSPGLKVKLLVTYISQTSRSTQRG